MARQRIGIFSGSFDPVHKGHITFALQAIQEVNLDKVYFLPEIRPRKKANITHIGHRVAMLKLAVKAYPKLAVLELPDKQFSVTSTMPRLTKRFGDSDIFFLMGVDVLKHLHEWVLAKQLLKSSGLVIARRVDSRQNIETAINRLPALAQSLYVINNLEPSLSSSQIREDYEKGKSNKYSLKSIDSYIKKHWLYQSVRT